MELIELTALDTGALRDHLITLDDQQVQQIVNTARLSMTNPLYADDEPLAARITMVERTARTMLAERTA